MPTTNISSSSCCSPCSEPGSHLPLRIALFKVAETKAFSAGFVDCLVSQPPWSCRTPSLTARTAAELTPPQRQLFPENCLASDIVICPGSARPMNREPILIDTCAVGILLPRCTPLCFQIRGKAAGHTEHLVGLPDTLSHHGQIFEVMVHESPRTFYSWIFL